MSGKTSLDQLLTLLKWIGYILTTLLILAFLPMAGIIDGVFQLHLDGWQLVKLAMISPIILHGLLTLLIGLPSCVGMGEGAWVGTLVLAVAPSSVAVWFMFGLLG